MSSSNCAVVASSTKILDRVPVSRAILQDSWPALPTPVAVADQLPFVA
jgi:hypothetical protein